jgi:histone H3/H4
MTDKEIEKDIVFAQLRNLVDPLFLSKETLKHVETYFPFNEIQSKAQQRQVTRNAISEFIVMFAKVLRQEVKSSGRTVIESSDIASAFNKVKASCPF